MLDDVKSLFRRWRRKVFGDLVKLLIGDGKAIVMVHNTANDGEYKVFELTWNGNSDADTDGDNDGAVTAVELGSLDFGDSLEGLLAVNLVGSSDYANLLATGIS